MPAHHLGNQRGARGVSAEGQPQHAVATDLLYRSQACAFEVLAQQHHERAGLVKGLGHALGAEGHAGMLGVRGEHQPVVRAAGTDEQGHGKGGRLDNLIDTAARQPLAQLRGHGGGRGRVVGHSGSIAVETS